MLLLVSLVPVIACSDQGPESFTVRGEWEYRGYEGTAGYTLPRDSGTLRITSDDRLAGTFTGDFDLQFVGEHMGGATGSLMGRVAGDSVILDIALIEIRGRFVTDDRIEGRWCRTAPMCSVEGDHWAPGLFYAVRK